jgi:hypothetical protein
MPHHVARLANGRIALRASTRKVYRSTDGRHWSADPDTYPCREIEIVSPQEYRRIHEATVGFAARIGQLTARLHDLRRAIASMEAAGFEPHDLAGHRRRAIKLERAIADLERRNANLPRSTKP